MKMNAKVAWIAGIALALGIAAWQQDLEAVYTVDRTAAVLCTATKIGPLLDNFNEKKNSNAWDGATGTNAGSGATLSASFSSDTPITDGGSSLKLTYDVTASGSYAYYSSQMNGVSLSSYTTISFWVKGDFGGELFKIELKNTGTDVNTNHAVVYITDYLDGGVTTGWQQVTIPLDNFANISDWRSGREFDITFENSQSIANGSRIQSAVYIDNITLGSSPVNTVRINHFSTKLGRCALGGNMGDMPNAYPKISWASHAFTNADYHSSPYSLLSQYDVSAAEQWAGNTMIFGGGADGNTAIPHNFNDFKYLTFYVKAKSVAENPNTFRIELLDNAGTKSYLVSGISDASWLPVRIDLTANDINNNCLDRTSVRQMNIVYEQGRIHDALGCFSSPGGVYIDDIQLEK